MKAKELIQILQLDPDADVKVSTVEYYERNRYEAGYERGNSQEATSVNFNSETNVIRIDGGRVSKV